MESPLKRNWFKIHKQEASDTIALLRVLPAQKQINTGNIQL